MKKQSIYWVTFSAIFLLLFTSCGGGKSTMTTGEARRLEQLGEEFIEQVDFLLPYRDLPERLATAQAVLTTETAVYNAAYLCDFYDAYTAGADAELMTVIRTKSFVITKLVLEGDSLYYFRYEYDPLDEESINISGQMIEDMSLKAEESLKKMELTLTPRGRSPIVTTFKNVVDTEVFNRL